MIKPHPEWAWEALKGLSGASGEERKPLTEMSEIVPRPGVMQI